jgi:potassium-transporting ATPase potassium-binding subunit
MFFGTVRMIFSHIAAVVVFFCIVGLAWPIGKYIAKVMSNPDEVGFIAPLRYFERFFSYFLKNLYHYEMTWKDYFFSFLGFHTVGCVFLFLFFRYQDFFSFHDAENFAPFAALNVAISFVTNTDYQMYLPEVQMSGIGQTLGLTVQEFFSASAGATVFFVVSRALSGEEISTFGNFWRDLVRFSVYVLLPLSIFLSLGLLATGVPQTIPTKMHYLSLEKNSCTIPVGFCASQTAIKQLGTNGGGYYNANSAHPLENPNPISNLLQLAAILLLPIALCRTYGILVQSEKQGYLLVGVMGAIFGVALLLALLAGRCDYLFFPNEGQFFSVDGNLEGKECRFGSFWSIIWSVATTATANGSVNCALSSLTPLVGGVSLGLMQIGEVVFGGIGTGLTGALAFLFIAVFTAGLMVGRTPEYLGKKIEVTEMKIVTLIAILPAILALVASAITVSCVVGLSGLSSFSPHGISEVLYAFSSSAGNNGSLFAGLSVDSSYYSLITAILMYLARIFSIAMLLALSGLLGRKKKVAVGVGTLSTETVAFGLWFCFVIVIIGALNFLPAFSLGPVMEHLFLFCSSTT